MRRLGVLAVGFVFPRRPPGDHLVLRNVDIGVVHNSTTSRTGSYDVNFVNPGQYELACNKPATVLIFLG